MHPERKSPRWRGFDYRQNGAYFVTVCAHQTHRRKNLFGRVFEETVHLNRFGAIVAQEWEQMASKRPYIELDSCVIMPDHLHGIVFLHSETLYEFDGAPLNRARPDSLNAVIGAFKAAVSREINKLRGRQTLVWERSFHDRVIRDAKELDAFRRYIIENPARWNQNQL